MEVWGVRPNMKTNWNRVLSLLLAVVYVAATYHWGNMESACIFGVSIILPLACIWFADEMGGYVGLNWGGSITGPSAGIFVCIVGWLLLLSPIVMWIFGAVARSKS